MTSQAPSKGREGQPVRITGRARCAGAGDRTAQTLEPQCHPPALTFPGASVALPGLLPPPGPVSVVVLVADHPLEDARSHRAPEVLWKEMEASAAPHVQDWGWGCSGQGKAPHYSQPAPKPCRASLLPPAALSTPLLLFPPCAFSGPVFSPTPISTRLSSGPEGSF